MNHAIDPCCRKENPFIQENSSNSSAENAQSVWELTKKSTTYGAAIEPTCDIVELVPNAELRIAVGNISAVCNVTMEYTALIPNRPAIAQNTIKLAFSRTQVKIFYEYSYSWARNRANKRSVSYLLARTVDLAKKILPTRTMRTKTPSVRRSATARWITRNWVNQHSRSMLRTQRDWPPSCPHSMLKNWHKKC